MEELLITALQGQGIWTICAVLLTVYVLKTSGERENKLHSIIDNLTVKFDVVEDIKADVEDIKEIILK